MLARAGAGSRSTGRSSGSAPSGPSAAAGRRPEVEGPRRLGVRRVAGLVVAAHPATGVWRRRPRSGPAASSWAASASGSVNGSSSDADGRRCRRACRGRRRPAGAMISRSRGRLAGSGSRAARATAAQVVGQPVEVVLAAADPVHDRHRRPAAERRMPGAGERHRGRPGVHVGGGGRVVAVQDLGREVARRAEQPAGVGELGVVGDPGQAEVDQDRRAALHQHVGRLHVAVQHADGVHARDALGQAARRTRCRSAPVIGPSSRHVVVQARARARSGSRRTASAPTGRRRRSRRPTGCGCARAS